MSKPKITGVTVQADDAYLDLRDEGKKGVATLFINTPEKDVDLWLNRDDARGLAAMLQAWADSKEDA